jgi:hypothetical protein
MLKWKPKPESQQLSYVEWILRDIVQNLVTVTTLLLPAIYGPRVKTSIASAHTRIQNKS